MFIQEGERKGRPAIRVAVDKSRGNSVGKEIVIDQPSGLIQAVIADQMHRNSAPAQRNRGIEHGASGSGMRRLGMDKDDVQYRLANAVNLRMWVKHDGFSIRIPDRKSPGDF